MNRLYNKHVFAVFLMLRLQNGCYSKEVMIFLCHPLTSEALCAQLFFVLPRNCKANRGWRCCSRHKMADLRASVLARINHPTRAERDDDERLKWSHRQRPTSDWVYPYSNETLCFSFTMVRNNVIEPNGLETTINDGFLTITRLRNHGAAKRLNKFFVEKQPYTHGTFNCFDIITRVNDKHDAVSMQMELEKEVVCEIITMRPPGPSTRIELDYWITYGGWMIVNYEYQEEPLACEQYCRAERGDVVYVKAHSLRGSFSGELAHEEWVWAVVTIRDAGKWWPSHSGWLPIRVVQVPAVAMGWT